MKVAKKAGTKSGNPIGRPRISAAKQSRIRTMRKDGVSYTEIAKKLGLGNPVFLDMRTPKSLAALTNVVPLISQSR